MHKRVLFAVPALLSVLAFGQTQESATTAPPKPAAKPAKTSKTARPTEQTLTTAANEPTTTPAEEKEKAVVRPSSPTSPKEGEKPEDYKFDMTEVAPIVTHHSATIGSKSLRYTATTGRIPIKDGSGNIEAEMFFAAYTLDNQTASERPVTFAFNGGPGSSSIWLHVGALGPKRVSLNADGTLPRPPYLMVDNESSALDKTDIVMVDAIGTGFSRPADKDKAKKFWSTRGDIAAFGEFIRMYISRYSRWSSPLYLFGESYGTTRSAGIAGYLTSRGINFNGIVLLSNATSLQTLEWAKANDIPYPLLLPTFTAIAWYHHKLPADLQQGTLENARKESERFAMGEFWNALKDGDDLPAPQRQSIIEKLSRLTGLDKQIVDQANLRIDVNQFTHNLFAKEKLRVGRLDGRFVDPDPDGYLDTPFYDPSGDEITAPFVSVFNNYVREELGYKVDMPYESMIYANPLFKWDTSEDEGYVNTTPALRQAMVKNPWLKVFVLEGLYDLATPYFAADYTFNHLDLPQKYHANISKAMYESGHMVYLEENSRHKLKQDVARFIDQTSGGR